ncbi:MAG: hypothetical protein V4549_08735 [Bacteroidota bacterium]
MKKKFFILFLFCIVRILSANHICAQTDTSKASEEIIINGKRYKVVDDKKTASTKSKKKTDSPDSIFVVDNKKFQYYNNWLTIGGGGQQNLTYKRELGFAGGLDFNFHIKKNYFQSGILLSGERFGSYNNYQVHLGYGKRFEDKDYHFAAFLGVSYSSGNQVTLVDSTKYVKRTFNQPGLYIQGEIIKKITYDVGMGASLFIDWNQEQSMIGLRFILYFSGAYTGKKNKDYSDY